MLRVISGVYTKNRITKKRAYPWTFFIGGIINAVVSIIFPVFMYFFMFNTELSSSFTDLIKNGDYLKYIILGVAVNAVGVSTIFTVSRAIISEIKEGTIETFLLSPASRLGYLIGTYLENIMYSMTQFIIIIIFGTMVGLNLVSILSFDSIATLLVISFTFFCTGVLISSIMLFCRNTYIVQNTFFALMSLMCGIMFPVEYFPYPIQFVSNIIPITHVLNIYRNIVLRGESISANIKLFIIVVLLSTLWLIIGLMLNRKIESKLIENCFS